MHFETLLSRRGFLAAGVGSALGLAAAPGAAFARAWNLRKSAETFLEWKNVGEGVDAALGFGGNSMVIRGKNAAALVDCKNAPFGAVLRREAEALGEGVKLTQVINTHHHADHTGGNHAFAGGLPIIAQEKAIERVKAQVERYVGQLKDGARQIGDKQGAPAEGVRADLKGFQEKLEKLSAADFAPTESFKDSRTLDIGGVKVVLIHFGAGHTDNDLIVHLPDRNVIHTGDLLFMKRHPVIDRSAAATTTGWTASLKKIIDLCDAKTRVVPGHGELTDVSGLRTQMAYFDAARAAVGDAIKAGKSKDEVGKMVLAAPFDGYGEGGRSLVAVWEELGGK